MLILEVRRNFMTKIFNLVNEYSKRNVANAGYIEEVMRT